MRTTFPRRASAVRGGEFSHSFARSSEASSDGLPISPEGNPRRNGTHAVADVIGCVAFVSAIDPATGAPRTVASTTAAKSLLVFIGKCLQTERRGPISRRLSNRGSQRQLPAGLLRYHVLGIPVGPVLIPLTTHAGLVLAVGSRRPPHRAGQVRDGREARRARVDPAGEAGRDLLQQPLVAVRIAERGVTKVTAPCRVRTFDGRLARTGTVKHVAHIEAVSDEVGARRLDVGYHEVKSACRARHGRCEPGAEVDRARRAWRRELHQKCVADDEVGIEAPAQVAVEALGATDVRNGDDDDFELHVGRSSRGSDVSFDHRVKLAHDSLLWCLLGAPTPNVARPRQTSPYFTEALTGPNATSGL